MKSTTRMTVNGTAREVRHDNRTTLAELLREHLRLTGTHIGCGTGHCGACTVLVDGRTAKSCCILAADMDGREITTIEALTEDLDRLHPVQEAFVDRQGLQCGFCTPGMILSCLQLLDDNPDPSEADIRHGIAGNLCRCTGYHYIVEAVRAAAAAMRSTAEPGAVPEGGGAA